MSTKSDQPEEWGDPAWDLARSAWRSGGAVAGPVVLIADDNTDARRILEDLLAHRGYLTVAATNGHAALLLARSMRPAAIVSELYLPAGGCACLAHAIKRDAALRHVPVVVHSSFVLPADQSWAADAPVDAFLGKPMPPWEVAAVIEAFAGPPFRARRQRS